MNTLEEIFEQSSLQTDYLRKYCDYVQKLISKIDIESVNRVVDCLLEAEKTIKPFILLVMEEVLPLLLILPRIWAR